jgi:hypothetical protein
MDSVFSTESTMRVGSISSMMGGRGQYHHHWASDFGRSNDLNVSTNQDAGEEEEGREMEVDVVDSRNNCKKGNSNKRSAFEADMTDYGPVGSQLGDFEFEVG